MERKSIVLQNDSVAKPVFLAETKTTFWQNRGQVFLETHQISLLDVNLYVIEADF